MATSSTRHRVARVPAVVIDATGARRRRSERVAGEEPLEIRVAVPGGEVVATTSTMRTPGQDFALAAGLLHAEGVIAHAADLASIRYCTDLEEQCYNVVTVDLRGAPRRELAPRAIGSTASCGVCGTATIDDLCDWTPPLAGDVRVDPALLASLPDRLREDQPVFEETGGLHAAGLFDLAGRRLAVHEDVGRHNALDKVIGERLLAGALSRVPTDGVGSSSAVASGRAPTDGVGSSSAGAEATKVLAAPPTIAVLSGRVSFELVHKAAVAGIPVIAAVSAPSSLAVETADRLGVTLAAFVRNGRLTVYSHPERLADA
ncbi:MAG: formate dehydrogenase accessory sulfurtransferase FdhD [Solirubrobacteraceae bacterium]|nr:formate dehydrogenase accessory sulfurtransferase FdhD [Solirubrobacteraceae bacterium]